MSEAATNERVKLKSLYVSGFKSFAYAPLREAEKDGKKELDYEGKRVEFGDVTVFLGANGAGKSNVVSLFALLTAMTERRLREFVGVRGGANSLLHYGSKATPAMDVRIEFDTSKRISTYAFTLTSNAQDALVVTSEHADASVDEKVTVHRAPKDPGPHIFELPGDEPALLLEHSLGVRAFQFHDTSPSARVRKGGYVEDAHQLLGDAGNLAAFLHALRINNPQHYERIRRTIRQACPQFDDFELKPSALDSRTILLNWRAVGQSEYLMGPHQLSDGTLRFMALSALLLQPTEKLPTTIVIDEPELGLHPSAIADLAALVKQASQHCQIVLATQSPTLVDHFDLEQIRVLQCENGESRFLDIDTQGLRQWLEDYTLGEMWQKNLFRGGPEHA